MLHNIGLLLENTPYGMLQLQHYSSGQKISNHMPSAMPQMESMQPSSIVTTHNKYEIYQKKDEGYDSGSDYFTIPAQLSRALRIYHISIVDDLFFNLVNFGQSPTTPEQHADSSLHRHRCCSLTCHCLVFTCSNDEISVRSSE